MEYTIYKDWERSTNRVFKAGATLDVTPELAQWFDENGYGEKKSKKPKKIKEDGDINSASD